MKEKVLITGGNGRIGQCIKKGLDASGDYEVFIASRSASGDHIIQVDYLNFDSVLATTKGIDYIIHLAFGMGMEEFMPACEQAVRTAFNLYEASQINKVKRVIFGSSNHVFGFYEKGTHISDNSLYRPDSGYGLVKTYIELLGRYYADRYDISCINVRIGHFGENNDKPDSKRATYIWLSNEDCQQLFLRCIQYNGNEKYLNVFGISNNKGTPFDLSGQEIIGFSPKDDGSVYREDSFEDSINETQLLHLPESIEILNDNNCVGGFFIGMDMHGKIDTEFIKEHTGK